MSGSVTHHTTTNTDRSLALKTPLHKLFARLGNPTTIKWAYFKPRLTGEPLQQELLRYVMCITRYVALKQLHDDIQPEIVEAQVKVLQEHARSGVLGLRYANNINTFFVLIKQQVEPLLMHQRLDVSLPDMSRSSEDVAEYVKVLTLAFMLASKWFLTNPTRSVYLCLCRETNSNTSALRISRENPQKCPVNDRTVVIAAVSFEREKVSWVPTYAEYYHTREMTSHQLLHYPVVTSNCLDSDFFFDEF